MKGQGCRAVGRFETPVTLTTLFKYELDAITKDY